MGMTGLPTPCARRVAASSLILSPRCLPPTFLITEHRKDEVHDILTVVRDLANETKPGPRPLGHASGILTVLWRALREFALERGLALRPEAQPASVRSDRSEHLPLLVPIDTARQDHWTIPPCDIRLYYSLTE